MNDEQVLERLQELEVLVADEVREIRSMLRQPPTVKHSPCPMTEMPKVGVKYFHFNGLGNVVEDRWDGLDTDKVCFNQGNCYATRESAELASKRQRLQFRELQAAEKSWKDAGISLNWKYKVQSKFCICWDFELDKHFVDLRKLINIGRPAFGGKYAAENFAESLTKDEQKLLWGGV